MSEGVKAIFPDWISGLYVAMLCLVAGTLVLPIAFNSMAIGFLGISWLLSKPWQRFSELRKNKVALALIGFYLLYVIGLIYTANMGHGTKELEYKLSFLLLPLFIATGPSLSQRQFRFILASFATVVTALCLLALGIAMSRGLSAASEHPFMTYFTYRDLSIPVGFDPIYMALYIVFSMFILIEDRLLNTTFQRISPVKWYVWPQLILLFLTLIFLSSRMEILVFVTTLTVLMAWWILRSGRWKMPLGIAIIVPLLSLVLISVNDVNKARFTEMVDLEADYTENKWGGRSIRIEKWKNAIECWSASPVIGVGSGDTMDELMKVYERNEFDLAFDNYFNPHNQYLQVAITFGVIGLLYLLWLFMQLIATGLRRQDWLLIIFTLIMMLSVVTESMFERQKGAVFFVVFAMLLSTRAIRTIEKEAQV